MKCRCGSAMTSVPLFTSVSWMCRLCDIPATEETSGHPEKGMWVRVVNVVTGGSVSLGTSDGVCSCGSCMKVDLKDRGLRIMMDGSLIVAHSKEAVRRLNLDSITAYIPAYPEKGETWKNDECVKHPCNSTDVPAMVAMVKCGCLVPVNFGKG